MTEPKLDIERQLNRIEAAVGALADNLGEGELVRTILYGGGVSGNFKEGEKVRVTLHYAGGGESRGEGVVVNPEELDRAFAIAKAHHAAYIKLAPGYDYTPSSTSWDDVPHNKQILLVATAAALLDDGVIQDRQMNVGS